MNGTGEERHVPPTPLRQPRLAELVADVLRRRILSGALREGDLLPKQEQLLEEFGVSKSSIREALRILETEGLVTVRRGKVGGATVQIAGPDTAAHMLGLVLQSELVTLADLAAALHQLEPVCAGLCAARPDRHETVVARLRAIHDEESTAVHDERTVLTLGRRFHEALVDGCGNETMIVVVGTLESLWSAHERDWAETVHLDRFPDARSRRVGHRAHAQIIELIEAGDVDGVITTVRRHVAGAQAYALAEAGNRLVDVRALRVTPA